MSYDGHDELGERMPFTRETLARYERLDQQRLYHLGLARYYGGPCPAGADPFTWQAQRDAHAAWAEQMREEMHAMVLAGLVDDDACIPADTPPQEAPSDVD